MGLFKNKLLIEYPEHYSEEEYEIIALIRKDANISKNHCDNCWKANQRLLAWIDVKTGELHQNKVCLTWNIAYKKNKNAQNKIKLKKLKCSRVIVRKNLAYVSTFSNTEISAESEFFVVKALKKNFSDPRFDDVLKEYNKPVELKLPDGTAFTLQKEEGTFEGKVSWLNDEIAVNLEEDYSDCGTADLALKHFLVMYADQAEWTDKIKKYAADEMTDLANKWRQDEDLTEITREDFANRILLDWIDVEPNGDFTFFFNDDEIFWGHVVVVKGNMDGSFDRADIWG